MQFVSPLERPAESSVPLPRELITSLSLALCDYLVVATCFLCAAVLVGRPQPAPFLWEPAFLWVIAFWRQDLYPGYSHSRVDKVRAYAMGVALSTIVLAALQPVLHPDLQLGHGVILVAALLSAPLTYSVRLLLQRLLHRLGLWGRPVAILGAGVTGQRIAQSLIAGPLQGLHPVAFFDDDVEKVGRTVAGLQVKGQLTDAESFARANRVHHAIVAIPQLPQHVLSELTSTRCQVFKRLQFVPHLPGLPVESVRSGNLDNLLTFEVRNNLRLRRNQLIKRSFDLLAAGIGTLLISPLLLTLALLIRIDSPGPVLYSQRRIGRGGRCFRVWKFRSMVLNADAVLQKHLDAQPALRAEWEERYKLTSDPRITRVGRFLRKTSLDELPQLINVFRGEMSLVGPRPIVDAEVPRYGAGFELYKLVRPGMTGWWQVSGRSSTSYTDRVSLDEFYTRNWSLWFDLVILAATVRVVVDRDGAY